MSFRDVYVEMLPKTSDGSSFHQYLMELKRDIIQKLRQRGLDVTGSDDSRSAVLVVMRSTGRIGDELPSAILGRSTVGNPTFFAAIQDDEHTSVGRSAMPLGFEPEILLDFVVVPGTSRLKDCTRNDIELQRIAQRLGARSRRDRWRWWLVAFLILVVIVIVLMLVLTLRK